MKAEANPPDAPLTFAAWVKRERDARGWTQKELSTRSGIAEVTIRKAEGGRPPSTDLLLTLLNAFEIPVAQHEAYLGWIVGLRAVPPAAPDAPTPAPAEPVTAVPPPARPTSAKRTPDLAAQLLARLLPVLQAQQAAAATALETRLFGLLLYDRALARQEAAEWEAYREQTREANGALQRYTLLLVGLGVLLGAVPTLPMAGLAVLVGGLGLAWGMGPWIAWKRLEGVPERTSQATIIITATLTVFTIAVATWAAQPLFPLMTQLAPLFLSR